jgi:hypothetical protein
MATRIESYIVLGTANLEKDISDMLDEMGEDSENKPKFDDWRDKIIRSGFAYGHWVKVPFVHEEDETREEILNGLPKCLQDCFEHAWQFGARWILFDRDEDCGDLKGYEW